MPFLKDLFQFRQGESRIDGQKCPLRIYRFDVGTFLSAIGPRPVPQYLQQRFGILAIGHVNHAGGPGQRHQFPGLLHVAIQQDEILGFASLVLWSFIAQQKDVARQQRRDLFGGNLLADRSHA